MGSGPLGTFLSLSWKGSSAPKSSRVLVISPPSPANSILLPRIVAAPIAGGNGFPSTTAAANDIKTRTPNKMAAAAARLPDPASLPIAPTLYALLFAAALLPLLCFF
jgi:hypothetical protein